MKTFTDVQNYIRRSHTASAFTCLNQLSPWLLCKQGRKQVVKTADTRKNSVSHHHRSRAAIQVTHGKYYVCIFACFDLCFFYSFSLADCSSASPAGRHVSKGHLNGQHVPCHTDHLMWHQVASTAFKVGHLLATTGLIWSTVAWFQGIDSGTEELLR